MAGARVCTAGAALVGQLDMEEAWAGDDLGYDSPVLPWQGSWIACRFGGSQDTLHWSHLWGMVGAGVSQGLRDMEWPWQAS